MGIVMKSFREFINTDSLEDYDLLIIMNATLLNFNKKSKNEKA